MSETQVNDKTKEKVSTPLPSSMRLPHSSWVKGDPEFCSTCGTCELYCSLSHEGSASRSKARLNVISDRFTGDTTVETCRQCEVPACIYACMVPGAMSIDPQTGARLINEDKCVACGNCARACPYNGHGSIIRLNPAKDVYIKCDLCGGDPQCIKACRYLALTQVPRRV